MDECFHLYSNFMRKTNVITICMYEIKPLNIIFPKFLLFSSKLTDVMCMKYLFKYSNYIIVNAKIWRLIYKLIKAAIKNKCVFGKKVK